MRIAASTLCLLLVVTGPSRSHAGPPQSASRASEPEAAPAVLTKIDVSFKLDPRLTQGLYMGERWTSPPTHSVSQPAWPANVDASVRGTDATGRPVRIQPRWASSDPEIVAVTPPEGASAVTIAVLRPGEARLRVTAGGRSKELTIHAIQNEKDVLVEIAQVPHAGTPEAAARARMLETHAETSYAVGVDVGRRLLQQLADADSELVARGLRDGLAGGNTLLTEAELTAALGPLQREAQARQRREDRERLAAKNKELGDAFLAENKARDGVVTLPSGLQYRILKGGDGPLPTADDTVACHYRGTLIDGKEFDSSYARSKPAILPVKRLIKGWSEALLLMPVGSKWQLFVPPSLAYGTLGVPRGLVGPNATLVFEVDLLSIPKKPSVAMKHAGDATGSAPRR